VPDVVAVRAFAREKGIPPSTLFDAIDHGHVQTLPGGGIDRTAAGHWLEGYRQRAEMSRLGAPMRQRNLATAASLLTSEIHTRTRQIQELHRDTVSRAAVEAARRRRLDRLRAAIAAIPALECAAVAEALGKPPAAVLAMLQRFAELLRDLADEAARTAAETSTD
jgi:hypothetical protein